MRKHHAVGNFFLCVFLYDNKRSLAPCVKKRTYVLFFFGFASNPDIRPRRAQAYHSYEGQARGNHSAGRALRERGNRGVKFIGK